MTFERWMLGAFPWLLPHGPDYKNMRAAWDAGRQASLQVNNADLQICTCDSKVSV